MAELVIEPAERAASSWASGGVVLFSLTLGVGALLLFLVQPMLAKMILPKLGGTPGVWNTCMVFFQACLLAGYAYAHVISTRLGARGQVIVHAVALLAPLAALPVALPGWTPPGEGNPVRWLLVVLGAAVGLPFVVVATGGPLIQKWFAASGGRGAEDPYFLYAASNVGSVAALVAYPVMVEPMLKLDEQAKGWSVGYGVWVGLTLACAIRVWLVGAMPASPISAIEEKRATQASPLQWILLAFVPSSYLLGVTTFLTSDIAAAPLLWIIPLALYLMSFSLAFARRKLLPHKLMVYALPTSMLGAVLWMLMNAYYPAWVIMSLHMLAFFIAAMVCHGELARTRPEPARLTQFYLMISIGGVLGGVFNALLAPVIFSRTYEYPLAMFLACLVCPPRRMFKMDHVIVPPTVKKITLDLVLAPAVGVLAWLMLYFVPERTAAVAVFLLLAVPIVIAISFVEHRTRFAFAVGALLLVFLFPPTLQPRMVETRRSFFGVHRVILSPDERFIELYHGTTLHGRQMVDAETREPVRPDLALTYYTSDGPAGQVMSSLPAERKENVAMVGLGTGSMAAYAQAGTVMTFYEIDPVVREIAETSGHFSYLRAARERGADARIVLGDARLTLAKAADGSLDVLTLDAFSGDAVPVHLLTREAMELYLRKLKPDGMILAHVSNVFLNLKPVLAAGARSVNCVCLLRNDSDSSGGRQRFGWQASEWVVIARRREDLGSLAEDARWKALEPVPSVPVWTDDYSNVLDVLRWRLSAAR